MRKDPNYEDTTDQDLKWNIEDGWVNKPENKCKTEGSDVEMNVQGALWDMVDGGKDFPNTGKDEDLVIPFKKIWKAVCKKPKTFKEFVGELKKLLNDKEKEKLDTVIKLNRMDPANL